MIAKARIRERPVPLPASDLVQNAEALQVIDA